VLQQSCRLLVQVNLGELATTQFFAPLTRGKKDASGPPPQRNIFCELGTVANGGGESRVSCGCSERLPKV